MKEAVPQVKLVDRKQVVPDDTNPNVMEPRAFAALKEVISKYGFLVPIVVNKDMRIADGYHRWKAAGELGLEKIPVITLDVEDVDRRMLRQILNKLRGSHQVGMDIEEYSRFEREGRLKDLAELLAQDEKYLRDVMALRDHAPEEYVVIREVDPSLVTQGVRQIKLALTKEQLTAIKEKFGKENAAYEVVDAFIIPGD